MADTISPATAAPDASLPSDALAARALGTHDEQALLIELEPEAGRLYDRHAKVAQEWFPHDYIPYRLGRDFDKEPWTPDQPRLTGVAQTAFEINLLTEDNLPCYHRLIHGMFGRGDGAWINWVGRWTAEEGRHAIVLRDYLTVTRNIDPILLERGRMAQLQKGYDLDHRTRCTAWPTSRSRSWPRGSRTATRAATRTTRSPTGSWSGSPPTRTCTWCSTGTSWPPRWRSQPSAAVRAIVDEVLALPDARRRHPRLPAQGGRRWRRPASTTCASTATRSCCRSSTTGGSSS